LCRRSQRDQVGLVEIEIDRAKSETHLPVDDVVRYGPHALYAAVAPHIERRQPLRSVRA